MARILIVDDDLDNQQLLAGLLESNHHHTSVASDGEQALSLARSERPDLIISDVLMPTMDGYEFVRQLRTDSVIAQTHVIFITGYYLGREARALARGCGVGSIIYRPCSKEEILNVVDAELQSALPESVLELTRDKFDQGHLQLLTDELSDQVDELTAVNHKLTALIELSVKLASEHDPLSLLKKYCDLARKIIGAKWNAVSLVHEDTQTLRQFHTVGLNSDLADRLSPQALREGVFAKPLKDGRTCRIRILNGDPESAGLPSDFPARLSCLNVPIICRDKLYGSFCLGDRLGAFEFSEADERLAVALVGQMAAALENATLFRESQSRASDLEEKAQLTGQIARQQLRLNTLIANVPGVVWEAFVAPDDVSQQFNFVSDYVEALLGYSVKEWLTTPNFWLSIVHPEDRERAAQISATQYAIGEHYSQEFRWIARDGHIVWVESQVSIIRNAEGNRIGMRGVNLDITERKLAEEALRVSEDRLRQSHKLEAVGQLAGGVAHDFNNLLTVITGYSELALRRLDADDPLRLGIEEIKKAGDRAASLTRQLLAFSRKQVLQPKVLKLNSIVANVDKLLRRLIGEDVDVLLSLEPSTGHIMADPGQIEQVIINLAVNARDAMPLGGKLTIETSNLRVDNTLSETHKTIRPGNYVLLEVSDTGSGMDTETQSRIFEPFFTTKEPGKGTGLGLSTVYGIVEQSEGSIWVRSELGKGTSFKVYFPCVEDPVATEGIPDFCGESPQGQETILLAEDEEQVREMARRILELHGYRVLDAKNGNEALSMLENYDGHIDLLLTDAVMPQMSGIELATILSNLSPGIKVLYMSGYTSDASVRHGILSQAIAFLQKPFTPDVLIRKVREVLDAPIEV